MEFQLRYLKSPKMMLLQCCTQYVSKFGKVSSDHRTGKGFHSNSKEGQCQRMFKLPYNCYHFPCAVRTRHETTDWFKVGKEHDKSIYHHTAYLTFMQSTSCEVPGWMIHKLESRLPGEITTTSDMEMIPL